ncbi:isocitrate lyase/PEP mutase family protein [Aneurinibacillus danicus]|nr:oxaloacetate decarboxylase [Aneurinibacillus danicus]
MNPREKLRELLNSGETIVTPGAFDALSAKLIEKAGFPALYMTGYGTTASRLAKPDIGLLTMSEMVDNVKNISTSVQIPLLADGDTGYGNVMNVRRTIEEYEAAGAAAIQLEDQVFPKRCGHMDGKQVISVEEQVQKIRAAASARKNSDFLIIARTDARAVIGFDEAVQRALAYQEAGADILFIEAPQSVEEMREIGRIFKGVPLVANMVENGKTPLLTKKELSDMGYRIIIYPATLLFAATLAMQNSLEVLKNEGTTREKLAQFITFEQFNQLVHLDSLRDWEEQFKVPQYK